jgi:hypothetical protein
MIETLNGSFIEIARASALTLVETRDEQLLRDYYRTGFMAGGLSLDTYRKELDSLGIRGVFYLSTIDDLGKLLRQSGFPNNFRVDAINTRIAHERRARRTILGFKPGVRFASDVKDYGGIFQVLSEITIPDSFSEERARAAMRDVCGSFCGFVG